MPLPSVDDVPGLTLAEDGSHEVEITYASEFTSQKGRDCLRLVLRVLDDDNADDIRTVVFYPDENADSAKNYKKTAAKVRAFQQAFGLPSGCTPDDMQGATGNAITRQKTDNETGDREVDVVRFE